MFKIKNLFTNPLVSIVECKICLIDVEESMVMSIPGSMLLEYSCGCKAKFSKHGEQWFDRTGDLIIDIEKTV